MVIYRADDGTRSSSLVFWNPRNQTFTVVSVAVHVETIPKSPFPPLFKKTKHIMRESHYQRDLVARRVYSPEHVVSAQQLADILTKALPRLTFVRLRDLLLQLIAA